MVDWRRVGVLSAAVVITSGVLYVFWSYLSSRRRRKRREDEEPQSPVLPQPAQLQVKADENPQSPSQIVKQKIEAGETSLYQVLEQGAGARDKFKPPSFFQDFPQKEEAGVKSKTSSLSQGVLPHEAESGKTPKTSSVSQGVIPHEAESGKTPKTAAVSQGVLWHEVESGKTSNTPSVSQGVLPHEAESGKKSKPPSVSQVLPHEAESGKTPAVSQGVLLHEVESGKTSKTPSVSQGVLPHEAVSGKTSKPPSVSQVVQQQAEAVENSEPPSLSQFVQLQAEAVENSEPPSLSQFVQLQADADENSKPPSLSQFVQLQAEADENSKPPSLSQFVQQQAEVDENSKPPSLSWFVQQQAETGENPQSSDLSQPHVVRKETETQLEEWQYEEPLEEEEPQQVWTTSEPPLQEKAIESKYVLVLGLDGAGKSSILNSLAASRAKHCTIPTDGLNALCIATEDAKLEFLELGGSENVRSYWNMYLPKAHLLIFVVDSADHDRLPLAKQYLFEATDINPSLPVMILANKQDLEDAFSITQIHEALSLAEIEGDRKLFLISTHVPHEGAEIPSGLQDAKELISEIFSSDICLDAYDFEEMEPVTKPANEFEGPVNEDQ